MTSDYKWFQAGSTNFGQTSLPFGFLTSVTEKEQTLTRCLYAFIVIGEVGTSQKGSNKSISC